MNYVASIDIGGTNTRVALIDQNFNVINKTTFATDPSSPQYTLTTIRNTLEAFPEPVKAIGISCPGPLDLIQGVILTPPNLPGWHGFHIVEALSELTHCPIYLENDANLAALAESTIGAAKYHDSVQYITVSTGLGGGFVKDGIIFQGTHGFAQEIANIIMLPNGPQLGTLNKGSLESISSGTAIETRAKEYGLTIHHAGDVKMHADKGNPHASMILDEAIEYLANAVAMSYAFLDPSIVVIGGSVALKTKDFVKEVEQRVLNKVYPVLCPHIKIVKACLDDDSGLIGGGILAWNSSGS